MLLFSTLLEINDTMTKDSFIQLVLEWNQGSPHEENIIQGIEWNGERNVRYGTKTLWLAIEEYRNENIIAVRYEKTEADGVVWDTDYVMNFNDMRMSIQLDRSYLEEALVVDSTFSTPHFITLLIEHGYLKDDGILPMLRKPIFIKADNVDLLTDVINGTSRYRLPVVYISKTYYGEDPVDIWKLSGRLKGVAHVLVEEGTWLNGRIRRQCDDKNEFNGAIGVYFPNSAYGHKKYLYRAYDGIDAVLSEKVIRSVIQYCNAQMMDKLYTWQGVNNALLRDRLSMKGAELLAAESEKNRMAAETDELIESVDEDIQKLKKQVEELTHANEILTYENQGLRSKMSSADNMPILYLGEEEEFFQDEIKAMLLDALEQDVLPLLVQVLRAREQIDLALPFVRADIQIGAGIADELDGNGLLLGVIHDADVRVRAVKHLAALRADAAGAFAGRGALHGGAEDARKRVPPGALRPGQQEAVRQLALGLQRRKTLLQRIVSQKRRELHAVPSCCILIYYVIIPLNASFFYLYF